MWYLKSETRSWFSLFCADRNVIVVLVAAIVLFAAAIGAQQLRGDVPGAGQYVPIQAKVISYERIEGADGNDKQAYLEYEVAGFKYSTTTVVGQVYSIVNPVGQSIAIHYKRGNPVKALGPFEDPTQGSQLFARIAGFAGLVAAGSTLWASYWASSAVWARQKGKRGTGRIDAIETFQQFQFTTNWRAPLRRKPMERLVFMDNFGKISKTLPHASRLLSHWNIGDELDVYVGPQRTWWEGDVGVRRRATNRMPEISASPGE